MSGCAIGDACGGGGGGWVDGATNETRGLWEGGGGLMDGVACDECWSGGGGRVRGGGLVDDAVGAVGDACGGE